MESHWNTSKDTVQRIPSRNTESDRWNFRKFKMNDDERAMKESTATVDVMFKGPKHNLN